MLYEKIMESVQYIKNKTEQKPETGIILGSGLGSLVDVMEEKEVIPYQEIPNFPVSNVEGHAGNLVFGKIGDQTVVAMQGRFHYYEGYDMKEVTYPVYVLRQLGVKNLIVTNACGGINRDLKPGDLVLITDYINFLGTNSLFGKNDDRLGVRFPDMSEAYSKELMAKAEKVGDELGIGYQHGVYAIFSGPCYETAAEIRAYAVLGADIIGMSTVPETIAANYLGMKVLGIGCVTNMATGIAKNKHSHEEVLQIANETGEKLCRWVKELIRQW